MTTFLIFKFSNILKFLKFDSSQSDVKLLQLLLLLVLLASPTSYLLHTKYVNLRTVLPVLLHTSAPDIPLRIQRN